MISAKKRENCIRWFCALSLVSLCWGCATPGHDRQGTSLGTLHIDYGSDVYVNKRRAYEGMAIYSGDNVTTRDGSIVYVNFFDGGLVHIDQNTDPDFRKWFEYGKCIIGAFFRFGRAYGETGSDCAILVEDSHLEAMARTKFNIETDVDRSILTVIQGIMLLRMQGKEVPVHASQQVTIVKNRVKEVRTLSPEELREVTIWRHEYVPHVPPLTPPPPITIPPITPDHQPPPTIAPPVPTDTKPKPVPTDTKPKPVPTDQFKNPTGWCCANGNVSQISLDECNRKKGSFFRTKEEALKKCQPRIE